MLRSNEFEAEFAQREQPGFTPCVYTAVLVVERPISTLIDEVK